MPEHKTVVIASLAFLILYLQWPVPRKSPDNASETTENQPTSSLPTTPSDVDIGKTFEREYYRRGRFFIKRSLRLSEFKKNIRGDVHVPRLGKDRLRNEADTLQFIRRISNIPVPTLYAAIDIDDSFVVITEYVDGVNMSDLSEDEKQIVQKEINQHLVTLQEIKSDAIGGPSGIVIPPYRVMRHAGNDDWVSKTSDEKEYVFCHNDLSQHNIVVDPRSLKIQAIIDWEYAGFFPKEFEAPYYKRPGPSIALEGEHDDAAKLFGFMKS